MTHPSPLIPTLLLAAATGARSMAGVAATARRVAALDASETSVQPARFLRESRVAGGVAALAAMELAADKVPSIPNRTDPGPLFGRVAAGALIGATLSAIHRRDRVVGAAVGAGVAFVGAHLSFQLRRELAAFLPATLAALVEDAAVGALAAAGVAAMGDSPTVSGTAAGR